MGRVDIEGIAMQGSKEEYLLYTARGTLHNHAMLFAELKNLQRLIDSTSMHQVHELHTHGGLCVCA